MLPIQGNILEHLIHSRLMSFTLESGILSEKHFSFVPGRSTSQTIFEVTKYAYDNINKVIIVVLCL